jgi:hypothetical protein
LKIYALYKKRILIKTQCESKILLQSLYGND